MPELTETELEAGRQAAIARGEAALARIADRQPTIGQIVHYTLTEYDVEAIDHTLPFIDEAGQQTRNSVQAGDVCPAMIVRYWGGRCVNLQVFLDGPQSYWVTSRTEGDGPIHWAWPERV